ncbi:MAG: NUDIX domain-containing protein [Pseudomonadota bacterium]
MTKQRVFVPETFATSDILSHILSQMDTGAVEHLDGFDASPGVLPLLYQRQGKRAVGRMLDLSREESDKINFFFKALRCEPQVQAIKGVETCVFVRSDLVDTHPFNVTEQRAAFLQALAIEVMSYFGRYEAIEIADRLPMISARAWAYTVAQTAAPSTVRSNRLTDEVQLHKERVTHEGFFLTRTYQLRHPKFDGSMSPELQREVFVVGEAALVLPYDPKHDRILLVEQFRLGPFGRGDPRPWVLEPVAGRIDAGESAQMAARRECVEEAGISLRELMHMSTHYCSPGCSTEVFHCYLGLCDLPDASSGAGGLETEQEDIRTHVMSFSDAQALMQSGEINIGPLFLMLLWLERERARLRSMA